MNDKHFLEVMERIIYVLQLSDDCFYVGQAQKKTLKRRITEHFDMSRKSRKSAWVKVHSAVAIIETIDFVGTYRDGEERENQKTIEYMRKYGVSKVRGGYYTNVDHDITIKNLKSHGYNVSRGER